jgi:hypothetical protein
VKVILKSQIGSPMDSSALTEFIVVKFSNLASDNEFEPFEAIAVKPIQITPLMPLFFLIR